MSDEQTVEVVEESPSLKARKARAAANAARDLERTVLLHQGHDLEGERIITHGKVDLAANEKLKPTELPMEVQIGGEPYVHVNNEGPYKVYAPRDVRKR